MKLLEEAVRSGKARFGPDHPDTLAWMNNLAIAYQELGRTEEAMKLHEEAVRGGKARLGTDHPDTLAWMDNLANAYQKLGRTEEALKLHEEAVRGGKARLGPDHPDTLIWMNNLARSYQVMGRIAETQSLVRAGKHLTNDAEMETVSKEPSLTNSLGMKFIPLPGMKVLLSIWDTRVQDYQAFVNATKRSWKKPPFAQGPTHPAVLVT